MLRILCAFINVHSENTPRVNIQINLFVETAYLMNWVK